jgi:hypothetical protein
MMHSISKRTQKEYQETFDYILRTLEIPKLASDLQQIREVFQTYIHISKNIYDQKEIDEMWYDHLQTVLTIQNLFEYVKDFRDETGSISITYALASIKFDILNS